MIRGVSRQIIEVRETDNPYYESAYLVVKPEYASAERAVLEREALKLLRSMDAPFVHRQRLGRAARWLRFLLPALLGAAAAAVITWAIFF